MLATLHNRAMIAVLNHLLAGAPWARLKLIQHANKGISIAAFPFQFSLEIDPDGWMRLAQAEHADATIHLPPLLALRIALGDTAASHQLEISGDTQLAASFGNMLLNLDWDAEADLARLIGDRAAHQLVQAAQGFTRWQRNRLNDNAIMLVEYASEETPLLAKRKHIADFITAVDTLRDDQARLSKRIDRLAQQLHPHFAL